MRSRRSCLFSCSICFWFTVLSQVQLIYIISRTGCHENLLLVYCFSTGCARLLPRPRCLITVRMCTQFYSHLELIQLLFQSVDIRCFVWVFASELPIQFLSLVLFILIHLAFISLVASNLLLCICLVFIPKQGRASSQPKS